MIGKKKIVFVLSLSFLLGISFFGMYKLNKKKIPLKYGQIDILEEKDKKDKKSDDNKIKEFTQTDEIGNNYQKRALINEGVMFDLPKGFEGRKIGNTYYVYPAEKDKKNFSLLFAMRFSKNDEWKRKSPEEAKISLMDTTKGEVKYINSELKDEYNMIHLNRGKARKMNEALIYEEAKGATFASKLDPSKTLDMDLTISYIPLLNTNVEVCGICPKPMYEIKDYVYKSIVSSITEYASQNFNKKRSLDKKVKGKGFETMLSSKFFETDLVGGAALANVSNNIFDKDYDMFVTVGARKLNEKEKLSPASTNALLARYVYLSWFGFRENGSYLDIVDAKGVTHEKIGSNDAYLHNFTIIAQNTKSSGAYDVLNPARVTMIVQKIDDNNLGYIAIRHSIYNNDLALSLVKDIAKNTRFK